MKILFIPLGLIVNTNTQLTVDAFREAALGLSTPINLTDEFLQKHKTNVCS